MTNLVPESLKLLTTLPKKVAIGQKVAAQPISKFTANKGQTHIISFLDSAGTPFRQHYIKKVGADGKDVHLGAIHCSSGECCLRAGAPKLYYYIPIVEYTVNGVDNKGLTKYGDPLAFKYLCVKDTVWDSKICNILSSGYDATDTDFTVTLTPGKEAYQDMIIQPRKGDCIWRKNEQLVSELPIIINYFDSIIEGLAAKHVSEDEIITFFEGDANQRALKNSTALANVYQAKAQAVGDISLDDFVN